MFITFEGIDGAGKSTQIQALHAAALAAGKTVVLSREPGGTALGEKLRDMVLNDAMAPDTELALMFAARTQHVHELIAPALAKGHWVLCDRFTDATYAYQGGGRGLSHSSIAALEAWMQAGIAAQFAWPLVPDRTYLFDLPPEVAALRRAQARQADRFEMLESDFFARVRASYLDRVARNPRQYCVLDAQNSPEDISKLLLKDFATYCFNE